MFSKSIKSVVFISLLVSCSQCACEKALDSIKKFSDTALFDIELVNLPYSITNNKRLNITVQKADSYKFKIDKGEWSKEFDNSIPLTIDYDLSPGFHTVYIKGKIAGKWQNESRISYHKWSINIKTQFSSQTGIAGDFEGRSVAASADGSTIIMGADGNDEKGSQAGAVYVYRWDGNSWSEKKIVASDGEKDDCFGTSVAISSDGNTIIVGAYGNDEEGSQAGAAYIYKWNGSSWKETNKFYGKARLNYFGMSVSISPDGNSIIIGAYGNNEKGVQAGAAYLYKWSGSSWKETNKFYGEARLNYFGRSVSLSSGGSVAVVGAPGNKVGSFTSGAAYLYNWDGNSWKATKLIPDDGLSDDYFGNSISITPDGKSAIVGAPGNDGKKNNGGAAYIYKWNGSSWDEKKIMPANAQDNEGFGNSNISISADGNSVVVGATGNSDKGLNAGITYFFELEDSSWKEKKLYASDAASGDYFGGCISISSDGNTVIVGAYGNDIGEAVNKGSAYLFYQK